MIQHRAYDMSFASDEKVLRLRSSMKVLACEVLNKVILIGASLDTIKKKLYAKT